MTEPYIDWTGVVAIGLCRSKSAVFRAIKDGRLPPPLKFGRRCLWRRSDIEAWIDAQARETV